MSHRSQEADLSKTLLRSAPIATPQLMEPFTYRDGSVAFAVINDIRDRH
jgi:hypothetical protein